MRSSLVPWICPAITSGLASGVLVMAWSSSMTCVPLRPSQLAFSSPFISRSSERG